MVNGEVCRRGRLLRPLGVDGASEMAVVGGLVLRAGRKRESARSSAGGHPFGVMSVIETGRDLRWSARMLAR